MGKEKHMEWIRYHDKNIPLIGSWDTVIVGGGSAGSAAGITAARGGCKTLIIDKNTSLGGTGVHAKVTPTMPTHCGVHPLLIELDKNLRTSGQSDSLFFSAEAMSFTLETLYCEAGGDILYDTLLMDCLTENERIKTLILCGVEGFFAVKGTNFIDASGDAVLAAAAEIPTVCGDSEGNNQLCSLRFEMSNVDILRFENYMMSLDHRAPSYATTAHFEAAMVPEREFPLEADFQKGVSDGVLLKSDIHYFQVFAIDGKPGFLSFNCPHLVDLPKNMSSLSRSRAMIGGHAAIRRLARFLNMYIPGFECAMIANEASMLGVRESRRVIGAYTLTKEAFIDHAKFSDGVVRADWMIDVHSATGGLQHRLRMPRGEYYEIPWRCMICHEIENLAVAGRCISTDFDMQASVRIIPTCIGMGEVAGAAAVLCLEQNLSFHQLNGASLKKAVDNYQSYPSAK